MIQDLKQNGCSTLLVVTPEMLQDFGRKLIMEAVAKVQKDEEPTFTPKEFAARHHVDVSTLWRWVQNGTLKKTSIGKKVYYKDSDLNIKEG